MLYAFSGKARTAWVNDYCFNANSFACKAKVITMIASNTTQQPGINYYNTCTNVPMS